MANDHEIEIEFDGLSKEYYATLKPPAAAGSGTTEAEALDDLKRAAYFSINNLITSKSTKTLFTIDNESSKTEKHNIIKEKARKIAALLPQKNCGKCGGSSAGTFSRPLHNGKHRHGKHSKKH
jgi:hypothetical protein